MINSPLNELMDKVDCRYTLVSVIAKRAREIVEDPGKAQDAGHKPVTAAVEDLLCDRLAVERQSESAK